MKINIAIVIIIGAVVVYAFFITTQLMSGITLPIIKTPVVSTSTMSDLQSWNAQPQNTSTLQSSVLPQITQPKLQTTCYKFLTETVCR